MSSWLKEGQHCSAIIFSISCVTSGQRTTCKVGNQIERLINTDLMSFIEWMVFQKWVLSWCIFLFHILSGVFRIRWNIIIIKVTFKVCLNLLFRLCHWLHIFIQDHISLTVKFFLFCLGAFHPLGYLNPFIQRLVIMFSGPVFIVI